MTTHSEVERSAAQPLKDSLVTASQRRTVGRVLFILVIWFLAIVWALPLVWVLISSFKNHWEIPQFTWIPQNPTLENYLNLFDPQGRAVNIVRALINSVVVALLATAGALFACSCAGYAFARLRFWGRDVIFICLLATVMIPGEIVLVPLFLQFYRLGLLNSYPALIAPHIVSILGVFLMRQFMLSIPRELEEAASIEGAGPFTVFWRVVLPLTKPSLATLAVLVFLEAWNDFLWPLIVVSAPELNTLPLALITFRGAYSGQSYGTVLASVVFAVIPPLLFFGFAQNLIVSSISRTGIK
jgi:multiple sugar transport system permease protein